MLLITPNSREMNNLSVIKQKKKKVQTQRDIFFKIKLTRLIDYSMKMKTLLNSLVGSGIEFQLSIGTGTKMLILKESFQF